MSRTNIRLRRIVRGGILLVGLAGPGVHASGGELRAQAVVRSASPSTLSLVPGRPPVELILDGSGLDLVRSIEVTSAGRVVPGVSATIGRRSGTQMTLLVAATAQASTAQRLRATLVTERGRIEAPSEIRVGAQAGGATTSARQPVTRGAGAFVVTIAGQDAPATGFPRSPVSHSIGTFLVQIAPAAPAFQPPQPISRNVGTFTVTIQAPEGGF